MRLTFSLSPAPFTLSTHLISICTWRTEDRIQHEDRCRRRRHPCPRHFRGGPYFHRRQQVLLHRLARCTFFSLCSGHVIRVTYQPTQQLFTDLNVGTATPSQPTGWEQKSGQTISFTVPDNWKAGRIWGRRNCDFSTNPGPNSCLDGGCNGGLLCDPHTGTGVPPATVAEFTFQGDGNQDWYDGAYLHKPLCLDRAQPLTARTRPQSRSSTGSTSPCASRTTRAATSRTAPSTSTRTARRRSRARRTRPARSSAASPRASPASATPPTARTAARAHTTPQRPARRAASRTTPTSVRLCSHSTPWRYLSNAAVVFLQRKAARTRTRTRTTSPRGLLSGRATRARRPTTPSPSAREAVTNILYSLLAISRTAKTAHWRRFT